MNTKLSDALQIKSEDCIDFEGEKVSLFALTSFQFLSLLRNIFLSSLKCDRDEALFLRRSFSPLVLRHEMGPSPLTAAYLAAIAILIGMEYTHTPPAALESGVILTKGRWGERIDPLLLSELGFLLGFIALHKVSNSHKYSAIALARWFSLLLDANFNVILPFWASELEKKREEYESYLHLLFTFSAVLSSDPVLGALSKQFKGSSSFAKDILTYAKEKGLPEAHCEDPEWRARIVPPEERALVCIGVREKNYSSLATLFGLGNGILSYRKGGVALDIGGPCTGAVGDLDSFGIDREIFPAETFRDVICKRVQGGYHLEGWARLYAAKKTASSWLFAKMCQIGEELKVTLMCKQGTLEKRVHFALFFSADEVEIEGGSKLLPASLERYEGKGVRAIFRRGGDILTFQPGCEIKGMQIIPLEGGNAFWGSNYLISFDLRQNSPFVSFAIS